MISTTTAVPICSSEMTRTQITSTETKGDGTFEETGIASGLALSADGKEMSSMGVAVGDYDQDGLQDIFVTTFADDNYVLFHNDGEGFFSDVSYPSGVGEPTIPYLGWGTFFLDYDNDGRLDLFCANGHVYPEVDGVLQETLPPADATVSEPRQ